MSKSIVFKANKNTVTANAYVAHELYKRNEAIITEMGGEILRGVGGFKAQFPSAKLAKEFVEEMAVTSISKREYNATRKTEPKKVATPKVVATAPKSGKGKKTASEVILVAGKPYTLAETSDGFVLVPVTKGKGKTTTKKATVPTPKKTTKGKGKKSAPAPKKGKGKAFDFGKLKGKGRAYNSQASALIVKAGYERNSAEYLNAWEQWKKVR